jgi:uncharacterized protein (DUF302 family)
MAPRRVMGICAVRSLMNATLPALFVLGENDMAYYISRTVNLSFDEAIVRVTEALGTQGFGVLTDIDVKATMKKKLDLDFRPYRILGACNPQLAHKALSAEDKIGTLLPCNVIVQEHEDGSVEIAAIDPVVSMSAIDNTALWELAGSVREKLAAAVNAV